MGLARLERTAAHDSMLGCGHLDRCGRRGDDHLGGVGGLDWRGGLRDRHHRRGLDDRRGRTSGSATARLRAPRPSPPPSSSSSPRPSPAWLPQAARRRINPSRSAFRRTRSAWASSMLEEWLFTPIPSATQRSSVSLLVSPSSLASSWSADLCGQGCNQPFGSGLGEISSRARQPMGLSSAVAHSRMSGPISAHRSSNERR